jgi:hypothetical protein
MIPCRDRPHKAPRTGARRSRKEAQCQSARTPLTLKSSRINVEELARRWYRAARPNAGHAGGGHRSGLPGDLCAIDPMGEAPESFVTKAAPLSSRSLTVERL